MTFPGGDLLRISNRQLRVRGAVALEQEAAARFALAQAARADYEKSADRIGKPLREERHPAVCRRLQLRLPAASAMVDALWEVEARFGGELAAAMAQRIALEQSHGR